MASVIDVQNHFQQYYQIYLGGQLYWLKRNVPTFHEHSSRSFSYNNRVLH